MHSQAAATQGRLSPSVARAIVAGFIALAISTVVLVVVSGLAGSIGELNRGSGQLFDWMYQLTHNEVVELGRSRLFAGLAVHLVSGLIWAVVYALFFEPRLRQYPGWQAGAIFSLLPFLLSVIVFLPLTGGGLFGSALNAGPLPVIGNLILHLIYGGTLGAGYSANVEAVESVGDAAVQHRTMTHSESRAAMGILGGVVIGVVGGALLGYVLPAPQLEKLVVSWPLALAVAFGLAGGSVGALIGSLAGLSDPHVVELVSPAAKGQPLAAALVPLGAIAMVATFIVSIGSALLTIGNTFATTPREGYDRAIVLGLSILAVVTIGATVLDKFRPKSSGPGH